MGGDGEREREMRRSKGWGAGVGIGREIEGGLCGSSAGMAAAHPPPPLRLLRRRPLRNLRRVPRAADPLPLQKRHDAPRPERGSKQTSRKANKLASMHAQQAA